MISGVAPLAADARQTAGVLLLALLAVEWGGAFLARTVGGQQPQTALQQSFHRAGHAHAGVLVVLGLVCQLLLSSTDLEGVWRAIARSGVPLAAVLMPAGFFLAVTGNGTERPNRAIVLVWVGSASLAAGVMALGVGLLMAD